MTKSSANTQTWALFLLLSAIWGSSYLFMPIFAIGLGFVVLGEVLSPIEIVGAALIIGGVVLVNASIGQRSLVRRAGSA